MALCWVTLAFVTLGCHALDYPDFDAYDLYEDDYVAPNPHQFFYRTSPSSRYRTAKLNVPMIQPQDLFPYDFPSDNAYYKMPRVPKFNFQGGVYVKPGKFRLQGADAIVDDINDDPEPVIVKKTSGKNPPPLPMGLDNLMATSRSMRYDSIPARRTLGLLTQGLMDLAGNPRLTIEHDDVELDRQRERLEDLRFQASLDKLHSQNEVDDLRHEMRNRYDQYESDRDLEYQLAVDRVRNDNRLDIIDQDLRLQKLEDYYYNNQNTVVTRYKTTPKITTNTKTRFTVGFPIPIIG